MNTKTDRALRKDLDGKYSLENILPNGVQPEIEELQDPPTIICNKAKCLLCEETIISHHRHDYKACRCLGLYVDGGNDYLKRSFGSKGCYEELSVMSDSPFMFFFHSSL